MVVGSLRTGEPFVSTKYYFASADDRWSPLRYFDLIQDCFLLVTFLFQKKSNRVPSGETPLVVSPLSASPKFTLSGAYDEEYGGFSPPYPSVSF